MGYLPHRSCKGAINAKLNPLRTKQQLHESAVGRRIAELFAQEEDEKISIEKLFERFNSKCFKTKKNLNFDDRKSWAIDHILPSKFLYPLSIENAALLSKEANDNKRDEDVKVTDHNDTSTEKGEVVEHEDEEKKDDL